MVALIGSGSGYGSGSGDGYGYGSGSGDGYGSGDGDGYGYGYDDGDGYGYDDGSGHGHGHGSGDGSGSGDEYLAALLPAAAGEAGAVAVAAGARLAYWRSDAGGRPANGGDGPAVGVGQEQWVAGPLRICTRRALHGTTNPAKWKGDRLWVVALYGEIQTDGDKLAALHRRILAEITPNPWAE